MRPLAILLLLPVLLRAEESATALSGSAQALTEAAAVESETYQVSAQREDKTALKLPGTLHETPRSLTVIDSQTMKERNFNNVNEAFNYIPGVFNNSYNTGSYHFYARGYRMVPSDTRVDGFNGMNDSGGFNQTFFGVERFVYLRGPAGLLYGATNSPGGMINLVTKKPEKDFALSLDQKFGGYAGGGIAPGQRRSYTLDLDATGPLGGDAKLLYRVLYQSDQVDHYINNGLRRGQHFQFNLAFQLDENTKVNTIVQRLSFNRAAVSNLISPSTSMSANDGRSTINTGDLNSFRVNLHAGGRLDEQFVAGFDLASDLGDGWAFNQGYRYRDFDTEINQFTVNAATLNQANPADPWSWRVQRQQARSLKQRWSHSLDANFTKESEGGHWKNLAMAGVNGQLSGTDRDDSAPTGANQSFVNIYTGVAETAITDAYPNLTTRNFLTNDLNWNLYLQDQLSLLDNTVVLTAGLGYGEQVLDRDYSRASVVQPANYGDLTAPRKGQVTPNGAILYNITRSLGVYTSYSTSYSPAPGESEDQAGNSGGFAPQTGVNYEAGVKWDTPGRAVSVAFNGFWTEMTNTLRQSAAGELNPKGNQYFIQANGEGLLSRGFELSSEFRPLESWSLGLGGAYIDAFNRGGVAIPGALPQRTPRWSVNGSTRYDLRSGPLAGLGAGLAALWQDERFGAERSVTAPDPLTLPAFARVDAGLYYRFNPRWDAALNVDNVLDQLIFVGGSVGSSIEVAAPRNYSFRFSYKI